MLCVDIVDLGTIYLLKMLGVAIYASFLDEAYYPKQESSLLLFDNFFCFGFVGF